ncbi:MAG TPA: hypothetical protein VHV78_04825 [Gemmatimonadaceae bacterium]|jgi:hypothetical protein|nr:hypothetical protein [Gemmatimonadaceae bacterium]
MSRTSLLKRASRDAVLAVAVAGAARVANAQASQRGQPKTPYNVHEFAKLSWLVGTWKGTSPGAPTIYETCRFSSDSTIEITYHADSASGRQSATGRLYLSVGRIFHTLGSDRWGAIRLDSTGVYFVPQVNAHNTYAWVRKSPNEWMSTLRTGMGGHESVSVYDMQRIGP